MEKVNITKNAQIRIIEGNRVGTSLKAPQQFETYEIVSILSWFYNTAFPT